MTAPDGTAVTASAGLPATGTGTAAARATRPGRPAGPAGDPALPVPAGGGTPDGAYSPAAASAAGGHGYYGPALLIAAALLSLGAALRRLAMRVPCTSAVLCPHEVPG